MVVGADFCFGKGRAGKTTDLVKFGQEMGFDVTIAPLIECQHSDFVNRNPKRIVRWAPTDAAAQLGHWHRIEGEVIGGEQRGRELDYPTANMALDGLHCRWVSMRDC